MIAAGRIHRAADAVPLIGRRVVMLRRVATTQAIAAATHTAVVFDTVDYDPFGWFSAGEPTLFRPYIPGYYWVNCKAAFESSSTGRRGCWVNLNGTTGGTGTICGGSIESAATGQTQTGGSGLVFLNGVTDYVGVRVLQNSGGSLNLQTTEAGTVLDVVYAGSG